MGFLSSNFCKNYEVMLLKFPCTTLVTVIFCLVLVNSDPRHDFARVLQYLSYFYLCSAKSCTVYINTDIWGENRLSNLEVNIFHTCILLPACLHSILRVCKYRSSHQGSPFSLVPSHKWSILMGPAGSTNMPPKPGGEKVTLVLQLLEMWFLV